MNNLQSFSSSNEQSNQQNKSENSIQSQSQSDSSSVNQSVQSNAKSLSNIDVRKLSWSDFQGQCPKDDPALAHVRWKIGYNYKVEHQGDTVQVTVDVWCRIDPSSWAKERFDELLHHQQGHYYIGMICALEFKKRVQEFKFTKNYKQEISDIFNKTLQEYLEMENRYSVETLNMLNTAKQRQWDLKILKTLNALQKYT